MDLKSQLTLPNVSQLLIMSEEETIVVMVGATIKAPNVAIAATKSRSQISSRVPMLSNVPMLLNWTDVPMLDLTTIDVNNGIAEDLGLAIMLKVPMVPPTLR